ncbi:MAG: DUF4426 domain-containing protein [Pseudomonadota bacterium]
MPRSCANWHLPLTFALLIAVSSKVPAQQSEMFGPYEVHYSVLNTTFIEPDVAASYGIVRGDRRAMLTLAAREADAPPGQTLPMQLKGRTWDLIQSQTLEFQTIREGTAVYYIADFKFINEEWRFFEITFRPEGASETYTLKFKHQLYL